MRVWIPSGICHSHLGILWEMAKKATSGSSLKAFCRSLAGTSEDVKRGDDLVFNVGGKMYAAFDLDNE